MRMLLKAVIDTEAGNQAFREGEVLEALNQIEEILQPEAFYGVMEDGHRAFLAVIDLADPSQIPVVLEPLYQLAKAKITVTPCMTLEDVKKGVEEAARRMPDRQG
jgi:hypothetical protein